MNSLRRWWRMLLHPSQAYYWTKNWQAGEAVAQAEINAGLLEPWVDGDEGEAVCSEECAS